MIVSLATWHLRNGLRALPLVPRFDMWTRDLRWTPEGFYLLPNHGSPALARTLNFLLATLHTVDLCVLCPCALSIDSLV